MGKLFSSLLLLILAFSAFGCGTQPEPNRYQGRVNVRRASPTPYPTRSVPSKGFNAASLKPDYIISFSGPFWVQLGHRTRKNTTVVVGIVPSRSGQNLENEVDSHRQEFSQSPTLEYHESGSLETKALGPAMWSWGSEVVLDVTMEQLVLFAVHPGEDCLLVARSEFPADDISIESHLEELVRIAEIVGPGI